MFKQKRFNNNRAQIIFTTHCTELLETEILKLSEVALIDQRGFGGKQIMKLSEVPKLRFQKTLFKRRFRRCPIPLPIKLQLLSAKDYLKERLFDYS